MSTEQAPGGMRRSFQEATAAALVTRRVRKTFVNMAERLGSIGGTIRWDSTAGQGCQVRGSIPLG